MTSYRKQNAENLKSPVKKGTRRNGFILFQKTKWVTGKFNS